LDVRFAFLCDAAERGPGGKISALGIGIGNFLVPDLSKPVAPFVFVCSIAGTSPEAGTKKMAIHVIDADGNDVAPVVRGEIGIGRPPAGNRWETSIVMQFRDVKFRSYGAHSISLVVDGHEMVNIPFTVSPLPPSG